jgi:uncharacterized protein
MHLTMYDYLIVCPMIFFAGFIDSIAGGGGLISLPAYLFTGLPVHFALGTNKLSSSIGTMFSTIRYLKNGRVQLVSALIATAAALAGSWAGARLALSVSDTFMKYIMLVLLPAVGVFMLAKKDFGTTASSKQLSIRKIVLLSAISGFIIGAYDGFFGPGTGTFLILVFTGLLGLDLTTSSGNAKLVNLASNIAALLTFISGGTVLFTLGIPAAAFGIIGNWIGSGLAIKKGSAVIRPVFIGVIVLLFIKIGFDLLPH